MFNVIELGIPRNHTGLNKVTCFYLRRLANDPTRTVWLNEILDFYTEDFVPVPADDLIDDADRYAPRRIPIDYAVRFTPYDWTIAAPFHAPDRPC